MPMIQKRLPPFPQAMHTGAVRTALTTPGVPGVPSIASMPAAAPAGPTALVDDAARTAMLAKWHRVYERCPEVDAHPEFVEAMVTSFLHKHLVRVRGTKVPVVNGEPALPVNGVDTPWSKLRETFSFTAEGVVHKETKKVWTMMAEGLVEWNERTALAEGKELRPAYQLPRGEWPQETTVEVKMPAHGFNAWHAWTTITDPRGMVTSFGAYPLIPPSQLFSQPAVTVGAEMRCPDVHDCMGEQTVSRKYVATPEKLERLKALVYSYATSQPTFNVLNDNCNDFEAAVIEIFEGKRPETHSTFAGAIARMAHLDDVTPKPVQQGVSLLYEVGTCWMNPLMQGAAILGSSCVAKNERGDTYWRSPWQLAKPLHFTDKTLLRRHIARSAAQDARRGAAEA
jgi:hypothetical protein